MVKKKYRVVTSSKGKKKVKYFNNRYGAEKYGAPLFGCLYKRKSKS